MVKLKNITGIILAGIVTITISCSKTSSPADTGPVIVAPPVSGNGTIRLLTYNVHHCNPPAKADVIDVDGIANVIAGQTPDLVALQEVDVNTSRSGSTVDEPKQIAAKLGMYYYFGKSINYGGGAYGVAILSKIPISETTVTTLPAEPGSTAEARVLATAKVTFADGRTFIFGCTHLDAQTPSTNRELEVTEINRIAAAQTLPFIIAGDFNAVPGSTPIQLLDQKFQRNCQTCDFTIPATKPTEAIDFIAFTLAHPFTILSYKVITTATTNSDHLPVLTVLQIP